MSPILTRPIREQLEHDRVIRQLQARYKRKYEVAINPGNEQNESVSVGDLTVYPDLALYGHDKGRRLEGTVEVETVESVTTLEAQFEWGMFSKLRVPFHLYVPAQALDTARRLCEDLQLGVAEIWTYHVGLDQQIRFTQVYRSPNAPKVEPPLKAAAPRKAAPPAPARAARTAPAGKAAKAARAAKPVRVAKPVAAKATSKAAKSTPARPARKGAAAPAKARAKGAATRSGSGSRKAAARTAKRPVARKRR